MNFKTIPFLLLSATMLSSCTNSCKSQPVAEQAAPVAEESVQSADATMNDQTANDQAAADVSATDTVATAE